MNNNKLIVSQDECALVSSGKVGLESINWIQGQPIINKNLKARFRHGGKLISITIIQDNDKYFMDMLEGERAVTPGQSAVLYNEDECIGGGIISYVC